MTYLKYSCHVGGAPHSFASECLAFYFSFVDIFEYLRQVITVELHHKHSTEDRHVVSLKLCSFLSS